MVPATAPVRAALLSACGSDGDETSSGHGCLYTAFGGNKYSGKYTGGWKDGRFNGEGSFSGRGEKGGISLAGTWAGG